MTVETQNIITKSWNESSNQLFAFILSKVNNKEDAEDLLQEVFVKSINSIDKLREDSNMNAWLFAVTRNTINDFFRKKSGKYSTEINDEIDYFQEEVPYEDNFCCLEPHIKELPEKYRTVILLSEIEGKKHKEISEKLGLSLSAIKSRVVRGRELLKQKFISCCKYHLDENGKLAGDVECHNPDCNH